MKSVVLTSLIILLHQFYTTHCIDSVDNNGFNTNNLKIIGLYSICGSNTSNISLATEFHHTAVSMHLGVLYGMYKENLTERYHYVYFDVCNDTKTLLTHLTDIMLDPKYEKMINYSTNVTYMSCIFSYMTEELTRLAANVLTGGSIPMVSFNNHPFFPDKLTHALYLRHGELEKQTAGYFKDLIKDSGYDFPFVVSLNENYGTHDSYKLLVEELRKDTCVIYQVLKNFSEVQEFTDKFEKYGQPQVLVVMADEETLFNMLGYIHQGAPYSTIIPMIEILRNGTFHSKATKTLLGILENFGDDDHLFGHSLDTRVGEYDYSYILIELERFFSLLKDNFMEFIEPGILEDHLLESLPKPTTYPPQNSPTNCTNFTCTPGYERNLQKINNSIWKNKYSFVCVKCRENFIKTSTDEGRCQPCYGKNVSNTHHTHCYVPYQIRRLHYKSIESIFGLILNSFGILFSAVTFILFERFRKTPVVRVSDTKLSEIQLLTANALFLFMLLSTILQTTKHLCIARPVCIGFLFSLFISVNLAKSEKPLTLILSRKKLSKKSIKHTKVRQYLTIIIVPILSLLVSAVSFELYPAEVMVKTDDVAFMKTFYCNTDRHVHVQIVFIIFLLLVTSFLQAYRNRKKTDSYRESMTMLYSTFTCCVSLVILIPIYQFQHDPIDRLHVHWIILCIVGLILVVASYGLKVIIIIFYPEKKHSCGG